MLSERPPADVDIDKDSPELRASLSMLAGVLSRQLTAVAEDLHGTSCTAWQSISVAGRLDKLKNEIDWLRKDVAKFRPVEASE